MSGDRVQVAGWPGVYAVRFDSTGAHNKAWLSGQGALSEEDIEAIVAALDQAPAGALTLLLLHHHLLPYPQDSAAEWLSSMLGKSWTGELPLGRTLVERLRGRCDLVLHGHRHRPGTTTVFSESARPLSVFNAGASADRGHVRLVPARRRSPARAAGLVAPGGQGPAVALDPARARRAAERPGDPSPNLEVRPMEPSPAPRLIDLRGGIDGAVKRSLFRLIEKPVESVLSLSTVNRLYAESLTLPARAATTSGGCWTC